MTLKDLQYFVALAQFQHFGRAAEACYVSQPTLSMQIKKLEDMLDVILFERLQKTVNLTAEGRFLLPKAQKVLQAFAEFKDCAKSFDGNYSGLLKVGVIPTIAPYLIPKFLPKWSLHYPDLTNLIEEHQSDDLVKLVQSGELDVGILALPWDVKDLLSLPVGQEALVCAISSQYLASTEQKTITLAELAHVPALLLESGHCLRAHALNVCHQLEDQQLQGLRGTSLETLREMAKVGLGFTLMPKMAVKQADELIYLSFTDVHPSREIGVVMRASFPKMDVVQALKRHLKDCL